MREGPGPGGVSRVSSLCALAFGVESIWELDLQVPGQGGFWASVPGESLETKLGPIQCVCVWGGVAAALGHAAPGVWSEWDPAGPPHREQGVLLGLFEEAVECHRQPRI